VNELEADQSRRSMDDSTRSQSAHSSTPLPIRYDIHHHITMRSLSQNEGYRKLRERRQETKRIKYGILQTMFVGVVLNAAMSSVLPEIKGSTSNSSPNDFEQSPFDDADAISSRSLFGSADDPETTMSGYPQDLFSKNWCRGVLDSLCVHSTNPPPH